MDSCSTHIPPCYECLGVHPSISPTELARHYKKLSLQLHPDRAAYRDDPDREPEVQLRYRGITEAYDILSDPDRRAAYDARHGVNFQSRLSTLQNAIAKHNVNVTTRQDGCMVGANEDAAIFSAGAKRMRGDSDATVERNTDPHPVEGEDSDGEYSLPSVPSHSHPLDPLGTGSDITPVHGVTDAFCLVPCRSMTNANSIEVHSRLHQQWRTVTISRDTPDTPWGLSFSRNVLIACSGREGVPCPSLVTLCGGVSVTDEVTAVELLASCGVSELKEVELTLTYGICDYDLLGDATLLQRDDVMEALVSQQQRHAEFVGLLPGVTVLSVNGQAVDTACELREALRKYSGVSELEDAVPSFRGANSHRVMVIGCSSVEGVNI